MKKKYVGVLFKRDLFKYYSSLIFNGVTYPCGFHYTEKEAVIARDVKIIEIGAPRSKLQILKPTDNEKRPKTDISK